MNYQFKYRELAEALYNALKDDPFYSTMENSVSGDAVSKREAMLTYMDYSMTEAETYGELFIPGNHKYGVSVWLKPIDKIKESEKKSFKKFFLLTNMGQNSLNTYLKIVEYMALKTIDLIKPDSWYLSIVGIKPALQGQGLGATLINNVLDKTDKLKVPTYLETFTPRNMSFYERLGYKNIASIHELTVDSKYWIMKRESK